MTALKRIGVAGAGLIGRRHIELIDASPGSVVAGSPAPPPAAMALRPAPASHAAGPDAGHPAELPEVPDHAPHLLG